MEGLKELEYWRDAIGEELPKGEAEGFLKLVHDAVQPKELPRAIGARLVVWQFEDKPYGLRYLRAVRQDRELMGLCEEVVSLYRREIKGEAVPPDLFQDLHMKIAKAWDVTGWRERDRRTAFARRWSWLGARKWAWLGMRPWSNAWAWTLVATRKRNYAQTTSLVRLWAEVRTIAKKEFGKRARTRVLATYFVHLIHTP